MISVDTTRHAASSSTVYYDHFPSPLGSIVLAATDKGLCGLFFVGSRNRAEVDERALERKLRKALPPSLRDAELEPAPRKLAPARRWLSYYFAGDPVRPNQLEMPLDLQGTPFQKKVWKQLMRIPHGKTASYGEIARRIGQPQAPRAVGMANNRNPVSIVVPCHRVVGANGTLVGYGGGLWRKKALLRLEEGDLGKVR